MSPVKNISGRSAKGKLGTIRTGRLALMVGVQQCNNLRTKYVPYVILNTIRATNPFSRVDFDNFKPSPNHTKLHINGELGPRLWRVYYRLVNRRKRAENEKLFVAKSCNCWKYVLTLIKCLLTVWAVLLGTRSQQFCYTYSKMDDGSIQLHVSKM